VNAYKIDPARESASVGNEVIVSLDYNRIQCHKYNNYLDQYINL